MSTQETKARQRRWRREDVAERYQLPLRTVDYLVATGQIPYIRLGKRIVRFDPQELQRWEEERKNLEYRLGSRKQDKVE